jgi:hypothetical protein
MPCDGYTRFSERHRGVVRAGVPERGLALPPDITPMTLDEGPWV